MLKKGLVLSSGVAAVFALAACGGGSTSTAPSAAASAAASVAAPASEAASAPAAVAEIKVAVVGPMTGDNSVYGIQQLAGIQLSVDQLNAAGGIAGGPLKGAKVTLVEFDDGADPNQGAAVAQQLCDDTSLLAGFGHVNSSVVLAAEPIYEACGFPLFVDYASNPLITATRHANLFRTLVADDALGGEMAAIAKNQLGMTKVGLLASPDDYGNGLIESFTKAAGEVGLTIVDSISTSPKQKDFTPQITKIKDDGADGLILLNTYTDAALQAKQAFDLGWKVPILATTSSNNSEFIKIAGKDAAEGVYLAALFDSNSTDPAVKAFVDAYKAAHDGEIPTEGAAVAYNTAPVLWETLAQGASDRESVIVDTEAMGSFTLPITGAFKFNENHGPTLDPTKTSQILMRVQNGVISGYTP